MIDLLFIGMTILAFLGSFVCLLGIYEIVQEMRWKRHYRKQKDDWRLP